MVCRWDGGAGVDGLIRDYRHYRDFLFGQLSEIDPELCEFWPARPLLRGSRLFNGWMEEDGGTGSLLLRPLLHAGVDVCSGIFCLGRCVCRGV